MSYFKEMAQYNVWANTKFISWVESLSEANLYHDLNGSFGSVFETVLHIVSAEKIWLERLSNQNNPFLASEFKGKMPELIEIWKEKSAQLLQLVQRIPDHCLPQMISYQNLKGETLNQEVYKILGHVFNHGTYHRGQLTHMLRELKVQGLESTDLINFYKIQ